MAKRKPRLWFAECGQPATLTDGRRRIEVVSHDDAEWLAVQLNLAAMVSELLGCTLAERKCRAKKG